MLVRWILPAFLVDGGEAFSTPPSSQLDESTLEVSAQNGGSRMRNYSFGADCQFTYDMDEKMKVPSFYHTSEDVRSILTEFASNAAQRRCEGLSLIRTSVKPQIGKPMIGEEAANYKVAPDENLLDAVRIKRGSGPKTNRMAIMFAEHGRELITTELGMNLLKVLCGVTDGMDPSLVQRAQASLEHTEFLLMPNVDENGRQRAEKGATCSSRDNEHNVDLNRNWDYRWIPGGDCGEGRHGESPFSEPETQVAARLLEEFKPTSFLSIHSGANGLYNPGAATVDPSEAKDILASSWDTLLGISNNIRNFVGCNCVTGAAGEAARKEHPGASIDYVGLKMKVPYSQAWEVWLGEEDDCMPHFSPATEPEYARALHKWTTSMLYFAEASSAALKGSRALHDVVQAPMSALAQDERVIEKVSRREHPDHMHHAQQHSRGLGQNRLTLRTQKRLSPHV